MALMIILALLIGMSIGSYIYNSKTAHAVPEISMGKLTTGTILGNPIFITVKLSGTCIAMVKLNQTDECPSYKILFPVDNTNQMISGKFVTTNGFFHRLTSHTQFHYQMYKTGDTIIMIDPDPMAMEYGKNIEIVPHGLKYTLAKTNVSTNNTRIDYIGRFVDAGCKNAIISYSPSLLNDTINYLKNNCVATSTNFNSTHKYEQQEHKTDPNSSAIHKYMVWLKQAKDSNKSNCITKKCKVIKDPTSKW